MYDTDSKKHMLHLMTFCKKIEPFVLYYKRLIKPYNNTTHNIWENEVNLILPQIARKQKHGIITMLVSSFIGLAYEGISSFLHHKQNKALYYGGFPFCLYYPSMTQGLFSLWTELILISSQTFTRLPTLASSSVRENVNLNTRWNCVGKCYYLSNYFI